MNIKSLLLGSAAALVAVSGARAADAVVIAEPEPMEYVRICDTYGAGFYYIPGTETCLKVSGYVRYDIGVGYTRLRGRLDKGDDFDDDDYDVNDTYDKRARFALRVDARSETELGTLRATPRSTSTTTPVARSTTVDDFDGHYATRRDSLWHLNHAYIELGGFRIGKTDSLFSTFTGYSSGVIERRSRRLTVRSTRTRSPTPGTAATASRPRSLSKKAASLRHADPGGDLYTLDSYVPHVVGGIGYTAAGVASSSSPVTTRSGKKAPSRVASTSTPTTRSRSS